MSIEFTDSKVLGHFAGDTRRAETNSQRAAVSRLVTYCERLIQSDKLGELTEMNLRHFVNETCNAFDMAPVWQDNVSLEELDQQLNAMTSTALGV